jgi:predicted TIM-barrel enzyme
MARGAGATPLAVASGVTVDNVDLQLQHVDFALVASSVSLNNTDLNPSAVAELAARFAARRSSR